MAELLSVIASHCQEKAFNQLVTWLISNITLYGESELDEAKMRILTNSRARAEIARALANMRTRLPSLLSGLAKDESATIEWLVTYTGPMSTVWVTCNGCGLRAGYKPAAGHHSCDDCGMVFEELENHTQFNSFPTPEQSGNEPHRYQAKNQAKRRPSKMPTKKLDNFQDEMDGERWDGLG